MERLAVSRRLKDKVNLCLPAGDGLPIWTKIPMDSKLPMMKNPKGSVLFYTTKLGEPKHSCKQTCDFDLRDPNGRYLDNEYKPLHDPHLKSHFNTPMMRRHLIRKGFMSSDGKILCSLREFNHYRQYLRHVFFLEIEKQRQEELEERLNKIVERRREIESRRGKVHGSLVRKRILQQRERDLNKLRGYVMEKRERLDRRIQDVREALTSRDRRLQNDPARRQKVIQKAQQKAEERSQMLAKRARNRNQNRSKLLTDRETQKRIENEIKCMQKWKVHKEAQKAMLEREADILKQDETIRTQNIEKRNNAVAKQRSRLEKKIEKAKQADREERQKKEDECSRRLEQKFSAIQQQSRLRRRAKRRSTKGPQSTWDLDEVLHSFKDPGVIPGFRANSFLSMLNTAIDGAVDFVTRTDSRAAVQDVMDKLKNDMYPQYLTMLDQSAPDATQSRSVRFSQDEEEITTEIIQDSDQSQDIYRPVTEHVLTPCHSESDFTHPVSSFMETLLLRLLDDLNCGRLSNDDVMKLASYSMEAIQGAAEVAGKKMATEQSVLEDDDDFYIVDSSSSILASKMVDFTLDRILSDIKAGKVHHDDLASLTISLLDNVSKSSSISLPDSELDEFVEETLRVAKKSAMDPRDDTPVCDAMVDDFTVQTLQELINGLQNENINKEHIQYLAAEVSKSVVLTKSDSDIHTQHEILHVLQDMLEHLRSGSVDFRTMYNVVFTIVNTYSRMMDASLKTFESGIVDQLSHILQLLEGKAVSGELDVGEHSKIRDASQRLSGLKNNLFQSEEIITCILALDSTLDSELSSSQAVYSAVENALVKTKDKLVSDEVDISLQKSLQALADSIIAKTTDRQCPSVGEIFAAILEHIKTFIEENGDIADWSVADVNNLISMIESDELGSCELIVLANAVVRVLKSPVQSDSSFAATVAVKQSLKEILNDMDVGVIEQRCVEKIVRALRHCSVAARMRDINPHILMVALASLFRSVLYKLTHQLQTGVFTEDDVLELCNTMREKVTEGIQASDFETDPSSVDACHVLRYIHYFVEEIESGRIRANKAQEIGEMIVKASKKVSLESQVPEQKQEFDVTQAISDLEAEIKAEDFSSQSVKDVTKTIISSTSETAIQAVESVLRSIDRDVCEDRPLAQISSVPECHTTGPSADLVDFVLNVVVRLQTELSNNVISNLSMAYFFKAISDDTSDLKTLEDNAPENLCKVICDITGKGKYSLYVDRILNTFLIPHQHDCTLTDPLKAIDAILVMVSSEILTQFVKATLQTILLEMRDENQPLYDRPSSVHVLRSACTILAEKLIKEVLGRTSKELRESVDIGATVTRNIEYTANQRLSETPDFRLSNVCFRTDVRPEAVKQVNSKLVEEIILETLHNVISNKILERSLPEDKDTTSEIEDLVLDTFQMIVEDKQYSLANADFSRTKLSRELVGRSSERAVDENKHSIAYVESVILSVLEDMRQELRVLSSSESEQEESSCNIQTILIECIFRVLTTSGQKQSLLGAHQRSDVKEILMESFLGTIENVKAQKFAEEDLTILARTCERVLGEDNLALENSKETGSESHVVSLMEKVYRKIKAHEIDERVLEELSVQLATLGVEITDEVGGSPDLASPSSSKISNLITDVLTEVTKQMSDDMKDEENNNRTMDTVDKNSFERSPALGSPSPSKICNLITDILTSVTKQLTEEPKEEDNNNSMTGNATKNEGVESSEERISCSPRPQNSLQRRADKKRKSSRVNSKSPLTEGSKYSPKEHKTPGKPDKSSAQESDKSPEPGEKDKRHTANILKRENQKTPTMEAKTNVSVVGSLETRKKILKRPTEPKFALRKESKETKANTRELKQIKNIRGINENTKVSSLSATRRPSLTSYLDTRISRTPKPDNKQSSYRPPCRGKQTTTNLTSPRMKRKSLEIQRHINVPSEGKTRPRNDVSTTKAKVDDSGKEKKTLELKSLCGSHKMGMIYLQEHGNT